MEVVVVVMVVVVVSRCSATIFRNPVLIMYLPRNAEKARCHVGHP